MQICHRKIQCQNYMSPARDLRLDYSRSLHFQHVSVEEGSTSHVSVLTGNRKSHYMKQLGEMKFLFDQSRRITLFIVSQFIQDTKFHIFRDGLRLICNIVLYKCIRNLVRLKHLKLKSASVNTTAVQLRTKKKKKTAVQ